MRCKCCGRPELRRLVCTSCGKEYDTERVDVVRCYWCGQRVVDAGLYKATGTRLISKEDVATGINLSIGVDIATT